MTWFWTFVLFVVFAIIIWCLIHMRIDDRALPSVLKRRAFVNKWFSLDKVQDVGYVFNPQLFV